MTEKSYPTRGYPVELGAAISSPFETPRVAMGFVYASVALLSSDDTVVRGTGVVVLLFSLNWVNRLDRRTIGTGASK
ncbi:hypothetical protein EL22_00350 [Halostagnicola sp. A56]|nr:hypothetical protein EL22_00350 [Halostagnicola sp. A56]